MDVDAYPGMALSLAVPSWNDCQASAHAGTNRRHAADVASLSKGRGLIDSPVRLEEHNG